ncbi:ATP-grasp domain-containing protein [Planosporangium sp. 12N6]
MVVLVDAYGTGRHLRAAFADLGADVVHVSSTPEPLPSMTAPDLSAYSASLVCTNPAETAAELAALNPVAVVAGQEPGVTLADILSELLHVPTNGSALSAARRDKYLMIEAVRKAGLSCAAQFCSSEPAALVAWAERRGTYPVVVKPLAASGSQGVSICSDAAQLRRAAEAVLNTTTMYAETNTSVLVQSYLCGTEYIVDTVSCRGQRYDCAVWRKDERRQGNPNVYHRNVLVPPGDPAVDVLTAYVHRVLDALGIEFGASHAEVMMTADGPALVEIGARLNGVMHPEFDAECCGAEQASVTALAYLRPDQFLAQFAGRRYRQHREAYVFHVATGLNGTVTRLNGALLAELNAIESVRSLTPKVARGGRIRPTVDLPSSPLTVYLSNGSGSDLARDYTRAAALAGNLFAIAGTTPLERFVQRSPEGGPVHRQHV